MIDLVEMQRRIGAWSESNFHVDDKTRGWLRCTLGVCEEAGELAHAVLKQDQGIRGTAEEHDAAGQDAVGDICIYLMDLCHRKGWDFQDIIIQTAEHVLLRNWIQNPEEG